MVDTKTFILYLFFNEHVKHKTILPLDAGAGKSESILATLREDGTFASDGGF